MALLKNFRQVKQNQDGISFRLNFEDWVIDAPFPPNTSLVGFGENHELIIYPEWRFAFQADGIYEVWSGMFNIELLLDDAASWYRRELKKIGWHEDIKEGYATESKIGLKFFQPNTTTRLTISLLNPDPVKNTRATIWRVTKHPLSPAVESVPDSQLPLPISEEAIR